MQIRNDIFQKILGWTIMVAILQILIWLWQADLSAWDMPAHFLAAQDFREMPAPWFSGWSLHGFGGYPLGYFYPSLFEWIVGNLGRVLPLALAFKLLLGTSIVLLPFSIHVFLRELGFSSKETLASIACLFVFLLFFNGPVSLGGSLKGTFVGGLVSAQFSLPLYFFYLSALARAQKHRSSAVAAGIFLGLCVLSHAFTAFAAVLTSILYFVFFILRPLKSESMRRYFFHVFLALLISSCWWVPFLWYHEFARGRVVTNFNLFSIFNHTIVLGYIQAVTILVMALRWRKSGKSEKAMFTLAAIFILLCAVGSTLETNTHFYFPIHFYRLMIFPLVINCLLCGILLIKLNTEKLVAVGLTAGLIGGMIFAKENIFQFRTRQVEIASSSFKREDRGDLIVGPNDTAAVSSAAPFLLASEYFKNNYSVINGVFVESSALSPFFISLQRELLTAAPNNFAEEAPVNSKAIGKQLKILGINWLLSSEVLSAAVLEQLANPEREWMILPIEINGRRLLESYRLYRFKAHLVEFHQEAPALYVGTDDGWRAIQAAYWTLPASDAVPLRAAQLEVSSAPFTAPENTDTVEVQATSAESIRVAVVAQMPRWIHLKLPYFPSWRAYSEGKPISLHEASVGFMSFRASSDVTLRFEHSTAELLLHLLSLITLCLSLFYLFIFRASGGFGAS